MIKDITIEKTISTTAVPVRIGDIGGWLDTWFAEYGEILNLSVSSRYFNSHGSYRNIKVAATKTQVNKNKGILVISAADPSYDVQCSISNIIKGKFDRKNLLLASAYMVRKYLDSGFNIEIDIHSPYPPGASLGTSASVSVAVIKALSDGKISEKEIAEIAFAAETKILGGQSGTQDQFQAAHGLGGSINFITVTKYPETKLEKIKISNKTQKNLEAGLITVCYGTHTSSAEHEKVIKELEKEGPKDPRLQALRGLAKKARKCLERGNLVCFGKVMQKNTEAQRKLCKGIVSSRADSIIEISKMNGAIGWKVNGAGGDGGSITLLFPNRKKAEKFHQACQVHYIDSLYYYYEHQLSSKGLDK
jgi:D-glycero-alpha-D-manno-heptose-7-phosphate kinase